MAQQINIDFEKYITHNGKNILKMIKTKTNKYILIDCKTGKIIGNTKKEILQKIKEYYELNIKGE